jgi:hypothetical protein
MNYIAIVLALWTQFTFANLPLNESEDRRSIARYTEDLNARYQDLDVAVKSVHRHQLQQAMTELKQLDAYMQGALDLPDDSLALLRCTRCICECGVR